MARRNNDIDRLVGTLKRVDDERLASLSHTEAAQALYEEVTSMHRSPDNLKSAGLRRPVGRRTRRLIWEGVAAVGVAAIVLAVLSIVNVFGSGGPSLVEKAVAALNPADNAIVHVKMTLHETGSDGYVSDTTEESWARTSAPHTSRLVQTSPGSPVTDWVQDDNGLSQSYDPTGNVIYDLAKAGEKGGAFRSVGDQSDVYRNMILEMLNSGEAVMEGTESVDGRECLKISATKDYGTASDGTKYGTWYFVEKNTMNPVEWRMTRDGGKAVRIHFDVYEQLPVNAENLALLDLKVQHPGATIDPSLPDPRKEHGVEATAPAGDPGVKEKRDMANTSAS